MLNQNFNAVTFVSRYTISVTAVKHFPQVSEGRMRNVLVILALGRNGCPGATASQRDIRSTPQQASDDSLHALHGAAKSVLASAYFQRLAKERGLNVQVEVCWH